MSSRDVSCAAQKGLQEVQGRKASKNNPLLTPQNQYIGGTGVVAPTSTGHPGPIPRSFQPVSGPNSSPLISGGGNITADLDRIESNNTTVARAPVGSKKMSDAVGPGGGPTRNMRVSKSGVLYTLNMIREPVVEYQETRGISRNEDITFVTLVTSLCTQAYTAAITILVMLWNLMPLVDGLVYFLRFMLDKAIDIVETPDPKDKAIKGAILFGELAVVTFIIFLIVGLIFMPVYVLMARLFSKVFSMIAW